MSTYKIISFDGGGVRGAFTTQVLKRLTQPPYNLNLESTHMFAGTSTGSVIAAGLAMGLSIDTVADFYTEQNCKYIFSEPRFFGLMVLGPKYSNRPLHQFLSGQYTGNPQFDKLKHALVTASFKLNSKYTGDWLTVFFHNRQDPAHLSGKPEFDYRKLRLVDAVMASGAAPVYFPSYQIDGRGTYIDGGVVANNPGVAAIAVASGAHNLDKQDLGNIRLLSIANGIKPEHVSGSPKWGLMQWLNPFKSSPLIDILTDGVSDADHYYCLSMLGERYRRLQIELKDPVVLDDYKAVPKLVDLANSNDPAFVKKLGDIAEWFNAP